MLRNFRVDQSNAIAVAAKLFDLHNFYDWGGLTLHGDRRLTVRFVPNQDHGVGMDPLSIEFRDVDVVEFSSDFATSDISDLDEIGFKSPADKDYGWLMEEAQATASDHLVFWFDAGRYLRVHAREAIAS